MSWVVTVTKKYDVSDVVAPDATGEEVARAVKLLQAQHPDQYFDVNWVEPD